MLPSLSLRKSHQSATALVRSFLSQHPTLSTQELFKLGVEDERPALQPDHELTPDGKVRLKRVSNMREGSRTWVPPPTPRYPGHPFRSVHYFKKHILHQLEAMGLIRLAEIRTEMTDEAQREEAVRKAHIYTLRREREARKAAKKTGTHTDVQAVQPNFTVKNYAWTLCDSEVPDTRSLLNRTPVPTDLSIAWDNAERLETNRLAAEAEEAERIAERRADRRLKWKNEANAYKAERQRLMDAGKWEEFLANKAVAERRRMALHNIRLYAEATGEDVQQWFEELGVRDKRSMFGPSHPETQEEREDLAAEMYRQQQAELLEKEREMERAGKLPPGTADKRATASAAAPFGLRPDALSSKLMKETEGEVADVEDAPDAPTTFPVDMAWREQLAERAANETRGDSPFFLKPKSTLFERAIGEYSTHGANGDRSSPTPASASSRSAPYMSAEDRKIGQERLDWSRSVGSSNRGDNRRTSFGKR